MRVRQVLIDDGILSWQLDYGLELRQIPWPEATAFVLEHHPHNQAPQGWKFGAALYNGAERVAVMTAGRPVAAALQRQGCLEITPIGLNDTCPKASFGMPVRCRMAMNTGAAKSWIQPDGWHDSLETRTRMAFREVHQPSIRRR
jgi:hypothetical protein